MTTIRDREILIIEDSPAVGILLKEFLTKLGIEKFHFCQTGKTGIKTFTELVKQKKIPIVFLDYNLPDMNAFSVMTQLIKLRPDVKVIIETVLERNEKEVKDVIAQGAYQYLPKPIRLEKLREIIKTLEDEDSLITTSDDRIEEVEQMLKKNTQASLKRISEFLNIGEEEFLSIISKLKSENKIIQISDIKEIACNNCGSVKITQIFHCPSCNCSNFKQENLIEHYDCGNVSPGSTYLDDKCPKCRKKIKVLGSDYRVMENFYTCNDCKENFQEIASKFLCLKCNNKFSIEHAKWETSNGYQLANDATVVP